MENDQLINEQLSKLPVELRQALAAVTWEDKVEEIALATQLSPKQRETLKRETMLILYGFDDPNNYIDNLMKEGNVEENTALLLAEIVNNEIIKPLSIQVKEFSTQAIHNDLPMVEEGERVHDIPHNTELDTMPAPEPAASEIAVIIKKEKSVPAQEPPTTQPELAPQKSGATKLRPHSDTPVTKEELKTPDYRYPGGADPYREPLA